MSKRICAVVIAIIVSCLGIIPAYAASYDELTEGTYNIDASLSCYVNAMGGVEFGAPLLTSAEIEVDNDGSKEMTLYFGKSSVTIYSITCDTFIDVAPTYEAETQGIENGTIGYYDKNGNLSTEDVEYTLSDDTAENANKEQVHYVDSITFPISYESDTYNLTLFINSNVMGKQFTKDEYPAVLTVNWDSVSTNEIAEAQENTTIKSNESTTAQENVESKDGLNIYNANETEIDNKTDFSAYLENPVNVMVISAIGTMIIVGVILVVLGKKGDKK